MKALGESVRPAAGVAGRQRSEETVQAQTPERFLFVLAPCSSDRSVLRGLVARDWCEKSSSCFRVFVSSWQIL